MQKYVLYCNTLCIENILDIADTEREIREKQKMAKIFRKMIGEDEPQMALVELSEEELNQIMEK